MTGKLTREKIFYCDVRTRLGSSSTFRSLSGKALSKIIDRTLRLYQNNWKKYPDSIELTCKNIVN